MRVIPTDDAASLRSVADQRERRPVLSVIASGLMKEIVAGELRSVSLGPRYLITILGSSRPGLARIRFSRWPMTSRCSSPRLRRSQPIPRPQTSWRPSSLSELLAAVPPWCG